MTEKLTAGPWLTNVGKIRWHLIRLLLRPGDAAILANAMYVDIRDERPLAGATLTEEQKTTITARRERARELYFVLRWMQRNPRKAPVETSLTLR